VGAPAQVIGKNHPGPVGEPLLVPEVAFSDAVWGTEARTGRFALLLEPREKGSRSEQRRAAYGQKKRVRRLPGKVPEERAGREAQADHHHGPAKLLR
jgi:hypothetical protein